ncbi:UvrD-helicase domain-containing protein [Methanosarcina mazei]|uniref:UvrD-helicase domain-containing protein n=1 Tax=Methanosarcina mazei TaxID=2209 RepID=UPI003C76BA5D
MNPTKALTITSSDILSDFDHHFRVFAGPGAGKTYWLINHIKHVLKNSCKINSVSKIACITYTNVATEQIKKGLGKSTNNVEISTIHSFLYKNIVKPYSFLLRDEDNYLIAIDKIDGHEDHIPFKSKIIKWINENNLHYLYPALNDPIIYNCLSDLIWKFEYSPNTISPNIRNYYRHKNLFKEKYGINFPTSKLYSYKKVYWSEGKIHHDDVLYFSYKILSENCRIKHFLSAKFPYIFIDEFQDTNPIQTIIIKWLAEAGSIIGVIGDSAQSIYAFQGARREDFLNFNLEGQTDYIIENNRRSTSNIVKLLNHMRGSDEIQQECLRHEKDREICILVNENLNNVLQNFMEDDYNLEGKGSYCILARNNSFISQLKAESQAYGSTIWDKFREIDSNRSRYYYNIALATEYANQNKYDLAFKELSKNFKTYNQGELNKYYYSNHSSYSNGKLMLQLKKKGVVLSFLKHLIDNREKILHSSLYEINNNCLYPYLFTNFNIKLTKMNLKSQIDIKREFFEKTTYKDLINNLNLSEDTCPIRTIHKSKGAEFGSVLVCLEDESDLLCVLNPDLNIEEHRLFYVAISRAMDLLFISVPCLSTNTKECFESLDLNLKFIYSLPFENPPAQNLCFREG